MQPLCRHHDKMFLMKNLVFFCFLLFLEIILAYELAFRDRVYPGASVAGVNFGNWTQEEIKNFFMDKNRIFYQTKFVFSFEEKVATVSGSEIDWGYHPEKISQNAYRVARSGRPLVDWQEKIKAFFQGINIEPVYHFNQKKLEEALKAFNQAVFQPPQNALFQFKNGRVTAFRPEKEGQALNLEKAVQEIKEKLGQSPPLIKVELTSRPLKPAITIEQANHLGIKERLSQGISYFWGSPPSRIHNIILASSKLNGQLIKPGEVFSFNRSLGDVSPNTGYQQALIIKQGRTILDDGGGVCQVSTTLFRAALNAGLPIIERWPHSYRVSYYEQGGFGPGLDATVFSPSVDLKFKNDTPAHILIQVQADTQTKTLVFELYGTNDGRMVTLSSPKIWKQTPPPEDFYQDEPSLPQGVVKQIEKSIPGAKVSFDWQVKRNGAIINQKAFFSTYQPWQAIYLKGVGG